MQTTKRQVKESPSEKDKDKTEDKPEDTENKVGTQEDRRNNKEHAGKRQRQEVESKTGNQKTSHGGWGFFPLVRLTDHSSKMHLQAKPAGWEHICPHLCLWICGCSYYNVLFSDHRLNLQTWIIWESRRVSCQRALTTARLRLEDDSLTYSNATNTLVAARPVSVRKTDGPWQQRKHDPESWVRPLKSARCTETARMTVRVVASLQAGSGGLLSHSQTRVMRKFARLTPTFIRASCSVRGRGRRLGCQRTLYQRLTDKRTPPVTCCCQVDWKIQTRPAKDSFHGALRLFTVPPPQYGILLFVVLQVIYFSCNEAD